MLAPRLQSRYIERVYPPLQGSDGQTSQFELWMDFYGEDLRTYINKSSRHRPHYLEQIRTMLVHVLLGLDYLHKRNLYHRDIKPQNILKNGSHYVLGDLGFVAHHDSPHEMIFTNQGTKFDIL